MIGIGEWEGGVKRGERCWHSSAKDECTCQRYEIFKQIFFKVNLRIFYFFLALENSFKIPIYNKRTEFSPQFSYIQNFDGLICQNS